jgi:hypothetical protein
VAAEPKEPDWDQLRAISEEMDSLIASDAWTLAEYQRIRAAPIAATNGHEEFCEFVVNQALPDWRGK